MPCENCTADPEDFDDLVDENGIPTYIVIYVVIFGFASIVGTLGNILVILTMAFTKVLRQSQNAFIISLAVADLMVSSVSMPASIIGVILGRHWYEQRSALCALTSTVCAPGCVASMHSIAWIAISRYYYIGQYAKFMTYFTMRRIGVYIFCIWSLGFLVHLPNHLGWGRTRYSFMLRYCSLDTDLLSYALFYSFVLLAAIFVSFVFYTKIYMVLRSSTLSKKLITGASGKVGQDASHHSSSAMANEIKIIKTSFKIFILFLITWSPLCVLFLINVGDKVPPWLYLYAALAAHGNSTLNFIVYFVENSTFRTALKSLCNKASSKIFKNKVFASHPTTVQIPTVASSAGPKLIEH